MAIASTPSDGSSGRERGGFRSRVDLPGRWSWLRRQSFFTFPIALAAMFAVWCVTFVVLYDAHVGSAGNSAFIDWLAQAPPATALKQILVTAAMREARGIVIFAAVLASPVLFVILALWMLKAGRGWSRILLYLVNIRSGRRVAIYAFIAVMMVVVATIAYFAVFYMAATKFEERRQLAAYFSDRPLAMTTAPFGTTSPTGKVLTADRQLRMAALAGLAAALALIGLPVGVAVHKRSRMVHGTGRLGDMTDAADFGLRSKRGIVLGMKQGMLIIDDSDRHVTVLGTPGSNKSRGLVIPSIMRFGGSMFVLDFGGELYKDTSGWLKANGYQVYLVAPGEPDTDAFNPLDFVSADLARRVTDLQKLSLMLMPERIRSDASDFWEESARILLTALLAFVIECPDTRNTLGELYRILGSMPDERTAITQLMERYEKVLSDTTRIQLEKFRGRHEKLGEGIAAEIAAKIDQLANTNLEAFLSTTTIPLRDIRKRKIAIFLKVDVQTIRIYERYIALIIEQMVDVFLKEGPLRDNQHDVMMMLDEFGNAGRMEAIMTQAPLMRKYGIRFVSILQDSAQVERLYERTGRDILLNSSAIKLYMNFQNPADAEYVSKFAGRRTEWLPTSSYTYRHGRRDRQESRTPLGIDVLPVSELLAMKPEEAILQVQGAPIFRVLKLDAGQSVHFKAYQTYQPLPAPKLNIVFSEGVANPPTPAGEGTTVHLSTLDGLKKRLGLDALRETGVARPDQKDRGRQGTAAPPDDTTAKSEDTDGKRQGTADDVDALIDRQVLADVVWEGSTQGRGARDRVRAREAAISDDTRRSPILKRQEVSTAFGPDGAAFPLEEGFFDGSIQPENTDPRDINEPLDWIMAEIRRRSPPQARDAVEELHVAVSDPLEEGTR